MEQARDCGMLIKQINDEMSKNANNALRSQNITLAQLEVLDQLDQAPEDPPRSPVHGGGNHFPAGAEGLCGGLWGRGGSANQAGADYTSWCGVCPRRPAPPG